MSQQPFVIERRRPSPRPAATVPSAAAPTPGLAGVRRTARVTPVSTARSAPLL